MHADESKSNDISRLVIDGAFAALNAPGAGFPEQVYENAPAHQRRKAGFAGGYMSDTIVERPVLVELKAANALNEAHHARSIDYLKAPGLRPGFLLNFGMKRLEIERIANTV